jgi:hypothetical protein
MSSTKANIADMLDESAFIISTDIMKLYMYPASKDVPTWREEIWTTLSRVPRCRYTNKFPSSDFIYKHTMRSNRPYMDAWWHLVCEDYTRNWMSDFCECRDNIIDEYFKWISKELPKCGAVSKTMVVDKLIELTTPKWVATKGDNLLCRVK